MGKDPSPHTMGNDPSPYQRLTPDTDDDPFDDDDDLFDDTDTGYPTPATSSATAYRRPTTPRRAGGNLQFSSSRVTRSSATSRPVIITSLPRRPRAAKTSPTKLPPRRSTRRAPFPAAQSSTSLVSSSAGIIRDTLSITLWLVQKPLAYIFALVIVYTLVGIAFIWMRNSVYTALAPVCRLPGVGVLELQFCNVGNGVRSDFPKLINLQTHFEEVLENSVGGSVMALDLKNSEIAVRDLNSLVKYSSLQCREDLSTRLDDFVLAAKSTSRQLSKFSSRVGGTIDSLLAMDEFSIRALERVQAAQLATSSISLQGLMLYPFRGRYDVVAAEREVLVTFTQAASVMDSSIQRLIREAELALRELDALEEKLNIIEDMVQREHGILDAQEEEVLAQIWTTLGGNQGKLKNFEGHKALLSNVGLYRKRALVLVGRSLVQLQTMQSNLEDLRDRVAAPGLLEDAGVEKVPLEVHIQSIRKGVDRLADGMSRAKSREESYLRTMLMAHDQAVRDLDGRRV